MKNYELKIRFRIWTKGGEVKQFMNAIVTDGSIGRIVEQIQM